MMEEESWQGVVWEARFPVCVWPPESVPSIKQDSASKDSQLGSHLSGSQAQHSWRCPQDLSPRLRKTGHSFCLPEAMLETFVS